MLEILKSFPLVYVGSPYSKYPTGIDCAFVETSRLTAELMKRGVKAYSPIAHTHPLARCGDIDPYSHDIWIPFDRAMMDKADAIAILKMTGWDNSRGIDMELEVFESARKPAYTIDPVTFEVENFDYRNRGSGR